MRYIGNSDRLTAQLLDRAPFHNRSAFAFQYRERQLMSTS